MQKRSTDVPISHVPCYDEEGKSYESPAIWLPGRFRSHFRVSFPVRAVFEFYVFELVRSPPLAMFICIGILILAIFNASISRFFLGVKLIIIT